MRLCREIFLPTWLNPHPKFINLSSYALTENEISLLLKGLKFCPTPKKIDYVQERVDMNNVCRKIKLIEYFSGQTTTDESLLKNKSNFDPPPGRNPVIDNAVITLKNAPPPKINNKMCYNISVEGRKRLKNLSASQDIIIRMIDKGSTVVTMNTSYYEEKIKSIFTNSNTYKKLATNKDRSIMPEICKLTSTYETILTKKEKDYVSSLAYKSSLFYGLPKIHKSRQLIDAITTQKSELVNILSPEDLSFRPTVAGPNCPTHCLSHLVDLLIQPFLVHVDSYVKDTKDIISKLPTYVDASTAMITYDVEALYSNITRSLGYEAVTYWVEKYPSILNRFSKEFVIAVILIILEKIPSLSVTMIIFN